MKVKFLLHKSLFYNEDCHNVAKIIGAEFDAFQGCGKDIFDIDYDVKVGDIVEVEDFFDIEILDYIKDQLPTIGKVLVRKNHVCAILIKSTYDWLPKTP